MPKRTVRDRKKTDVVEEQAIAQKGPTQTDQLFVSVREVCVRACYYTCGVHYLECTVHTA